jgi:hypothetical protein
MKKMKKIIITSAVLLGTGILSSFIRADNKNNIAVNTKPSLQIQKEFFVNKKEIQNAD